MKMNIKPTDPAPLGHHWFSLTPDSLSAEALESFLVHNIKRRHRCQPVKEFVTVSILAKGHLRPQRRQGR